MKNEIIVPEREKSLILSVLLVLIAIFLLITTAPIGFIYAIFYEGYKKGIKKLNLYLLDVALVLDQAGNVIMQHFLNTFLLKKNSNAYLFGNKKETISSVIGKNYKINALTTLGQSLNGLLNAIDKNHSLDSIDNAVRDYLI